MRSCLRSLIGLMALLPIAAGTARANFDGGAAVAALPAPAAASAALPTPAAAAALMPTSASPSGRVGRLRSAGGAVLFHAAGEGSWEPAGVNYPVASGEGFKTDAQGRAEIEIGADRIRLDGNTDLEIAILDRAALTLNLIQGRIGIRLARLGKGETAEVALSGGKVLLLKPGLYEISPSRIAVFAGSARFLGDGEIALGAGKVLSLFGGKPAADIVAPAEAALFAQWSKDREAAESSASSDIAAGMTGSEDLAASGRWQEAPGRGAVWVPNNLPPGWAPYRFGRWIWIAPWGWTWIDAEPWGFAPFHYGRWTRLGPLWAWVPGGRVGHPAYAPALVAYLGTVGIGLSYAGGKGPAIGWFPLGPGEIYWPSYSRDLGYVRALNRGAVADPRAIRMDEKGRPPTVDVKTRFANRLAATVVPRPAFAGGRPVEAALLTLPQERLEEAPALMGSPGVTPAMLRELAAPPPLPPRVATIVKGRPKTAGRNAHSAARPARKGVKEAAIRAHSLARARTKPGSELRAHRARRSPPRAPTAAHASRSGPERGSGAHARAARAGFRRHPPLHPTPSRRVAANAR